EHAFPIDDFRRVADALEERGISINKPLLTLRRSELQSLVRDIPSGIAITESLTTRPRQSWRVLPHGLSDRERQPWRFRRKLSLLRYPIVQLDEAEDPTLIIAPGLVRDGIVYSIKG